MDVAIENSGAISLNIEIMAFGASLYRKGQTTMALRGMFVTSLLLYVVSVDGYKGVSKRKNGVGYHCELSFLGSFPRQRIWVGTYSTEELAALACDVVFYYTNRLPDEYNFKFSKEAILTNCESISSYEALQNWNDRRRFIKAQANALISSLTDFHWEDVILVPSTRQKSETFARRVVSHFSGHAERIQEFMAWLKDPSTEQQILAVTPDYLYFAHSDYLTPCILLTQLPVSKWWKEVYLEL